MTAKLSTQNVKGRRAWSEVLQLKKKMNKQMKKKFFQHKIIYSTKPSFETDAKNDILGHRTS